MAYGAGDTLVVVRMSSTSGLLEDEIVNTFSFQGLEAPAEADFLQMTQNINDFYNSVPAGLSRPAHFLGESISRSLTHVMDFYKIQAGAIGSPIWSENWLGPAAPGSANLNLPTEVAAVLSFHGDLTGVLEEVGTTRPKARRRGRIFFGPLTTDAIDMTQDSPRLKSSLLEPLRINAANLRDSFDDVTFPWHWGVWSRQAGTVYPIVGGWTDNACDTQRRRGSAALARVAWGD